VEGFIVKDWDGGSTVNMLYKEISLTLEVAARVPELAQVKESIFSQGVEAPPTSAVANWLADQHPYINQWIGKSAQECCFQFAFRYSHNGGGVSATPHVDDYQVLFGVGAREQRYTTGTFNTSTHYRVNTICVSIQPALVAGNKTSIVVCRDLGTGSRDDALAHFGFDYEFQDTHDYSVFVRRAGTLRGNGAGEDLVVSIYDHTDAAVAWTGWPTAGKTEAVRESFWTPTYTTKSFGQAMWGACRNQGSGTTDVKTRKRDSLGSSSFSFAHIQAMPSNVVSGTKGSGTVLYHARFWRRDFLFQTLAVKALDRYGAKSMPLVDRLEIDLAFCPDSSVEIINGGWDIINDMRVPFFATNGGAIDGTVVLTGSVDNSPILAYGYDMSQDAFGPPIDWTTESLDTVPMWINWTSRNEGSLSIGVGTRPLVEIANKKWHEASGVQTFGSFANAIDMKQWTWITLYYHHIPRIGVANVAIDVWLERVFLDGNTTSGSGSWGEWYNAEITSLPNGMARNADMTGAELAFQYALFTLGGPPGMDQKYRVEIAEARVWDGEYYTAPGGGTGNNAFGPYMSSRLPPNIWDKLWYYLRFTEADVHESGGVQVSMDQKGEFEDLGGHSQLGTQAVTLHQLAEVVDETSSPGTNYYIPFPEPPMSAIRGIQIFRSQVVPVTDTFPNGNNNPNAVPEAWKACRDAPLYWLTEIPRGNESLVDTAPDSALGSQLDSQTGLIPRNPKGIFEWGGYLGIYVGDRPRIHFAQSPESWESFPLYRVFDIPVREYGPIEAAVELASRDARQSRVLCLGKSWGVFLDGSPASPQANTLGGGVGAASSRCLVVEKGVAYAYNGTLWAITGDGQIEDIGLPVLDLLPEPDSTRLSVSSTLSSLFVINEDSGLTLRFHLARRQWFVEDRYALSVTDIDAVDTWVHVSGYPSAGDTTVFQDDVESDTPEEGLAVSSINLGANTFVVSANTGLKVGQRGTLVGDGTGGTSLPNAANNPMYREAVVITKIDGTTITVDDLSVASDFEDLAGNTQTLVYTFYPGVGYWGTMIDTGQFSLEGDTGYVDVGIERGTGWWAAFDASDFAKDPADRTGFVSPESQPTRVVDTTGGGSSARWGLSNRQRLERLLIHSTQPTDGAGSPVGLTELELTYTPDPKDS